MEWSPTGAYVVLSTNSSVEVIDGTTFKLKWARTTSGALPTFLSDYPHPDRAHFTADGKSVWVRSAAGGTYTQYDTSTGAVLSTHTFSDWTGDYVIMPVAATVAVAVQVSVSGGVETLNYRTYDPTTWNLTKSGTASHAYVPGVDIPVGKYGNKTSLGFYDKLIVATTGTVSTLSPGAGLTGYNVAFDPDFGVLQTVVDSGTGSFVGTRRVDSVGAQTWSSSSNLLGQNVGFAKPTTGGLTLGLTPQGTTILGFDYLTGNPLFNSNGGFAGSTLSFNTKAVRSRDAKIVTTASATGGSVTTSLLADVSGLTQSGPTMPGSGVAAVGPYTNGTAVSGKLGFVRGLVASTGATVWSADSAVTPISYSTSKGGTLLAALYPSHVDVLDSVTGSVLGSYTGNYTRTAWVSSSQVIAAKADGTADRLDYVSGSLTLHDTLNKVAFKSGLAVSADNGFAIGYANGNIHLVRLSNGTEILTSYPGYDSAWDSFFRIVPASNSQVGILTGTSTGLKWTIYKIVASKLVADTTVNFTPPFTLGTTGVSLAGDLTVNGASLVASFFAGNGIGIDGTPTSELKVVRVSDGKDLGTFDNQFSYIGDLRFSPEGSTLFAATGGDTAVMSADSGPQDLYSLKVPSWLASISAVSSSAPSGSTVIVAPRLANRAPVGGTTVNLSVSGTGATIPASIKLVTYALTGNASLVLPAVATDTPFTVTATIDGFPESVSTTVTAKAPVPSTVTFSGIANMGKTFTGTVTLAGIAPTGGSVVTLSSDKTDVQVPATVTVPAGTNFTTFTVTTDASPANTTANISATLGGTTATGAATIARTSILTFSFSPTTLLAGNSTTGTLKINGTPGPSGIDVALTSTNASAPVPATVHFDEGVTTQTITINTIASGNTTSPVITGTIGGLSPKTVTLTINQTPVSSLTLSPASLPAGNSSTATLTVGAPASTGGLVVAISYTGTGVSGPSTVTIPSGATSTTYTVTTTSALTGQGASTTATLGASTKTANLTITPTQVTSFVFNNPSLTGGTNSTGTITISAPAPAGGLVVNLTNDKPSLVTSPSTITIAAGATSANFSWVTTPTLSSQTATFTAKIASVGPTATQTVVPPKVTGITFTPSTVTGGSGATFTVTLDGPTPAGYSITLTNGNTGRMTITSVNPMKPTTGSTSASGTVTTTAGAATSATLTATGVGGGTATTTLTIN